METASRRGFDRPSKLEQLKKYMVHLLLCTQEWPDTVGIISACAQVTLNYAHAAGSLNARLETNTLFQL